jgi:hypothetical protein
MRSIQEAFQDKPMSQEASELQVMTQEYCKNANLRAPFVENAADGSV